MIGLRVPLAEPIEHDGGRIEAVSLRPLDDAERRAIWRRHKTKYRRGVAAVMTAASIPYSVAMKLVTKDLQRIESALFDLGF